MQKTHGNNLIFLISQPRAGSTLLQRIIGAHPDVHTESEPWVMLHPLFARRKTGVETAYSHDHATRALTDFITSLPGRDGEYTEALRTMYGSLYESILHSTGKKRFLDKTPRYYFIIKELYELFPAARFIILIRNPLAVLASIMNTWTDTDWRRLAHYRHDLLDAPDMVLSGAQHLDDTSHIVWYEELVKNPETSIRELCDFLSLSFNPDMIRYGNNTREKWHYGDQETIYKKDRPDLTHADKWIDSTTGPEARTIMKEYLEYLGEKRMRDLGYSYTDCMELVRKHEQPRSAGDDREKRIGSKTIPDKLTDTAGLRQEIILNKDEQIAKIKDQILNKDEQIAKIKDQILNKDEQIAKIKDQILNKDEQITQIKNQILNKDEQIAKIKDQILNKDEQITQIKDQIKGKDDFISQVEGTLSLKIKEIHHLFATSARLEKDLNDKIEAIHHLFATTVRLEKDLNDKIEEIHHLFATNALLEKDLNDKIEEMKQMSVNMEQMSKNMEELRMHMTNKDNYIHSILNSNTYKIGDMLLKPIKIIINAIKK